MHRLSLSRIEEASRTIDRAFLHSPQVELGDVTLKVETINPVRSFKGRGADFFVAEAVRAGDRGPWTCASAGNFGLGMAYACRKHGIALTVFVARGASVVKLDRMQRLGAELRVAGDDFEEAKSAARAWSREHGVRFVEDGREPHIAEGAGSIAVELRGTFDAVVVPVGDGALVTGMGRWLRAHAPGTSVIGVCSSGATAVHDSWHRGTVASAAVATIADGIAVRAPIAEALEDMRGLVDDVVLVDDAMLIAAMRVLRDDVGLVVEPAGAAGLAAIRANRIRAGMRVATVVTGGNYSAS